MCTESSVISSLAGEPASLKLFNQSDLDVTPHLVHNFFVRIFSEYIIILIMYQSLLLASGTTSANGVDNGVGRGEVRQTGQVGCNLSHGSTHLR